MPRDRQQRGHKGLLDVGKAEILGDARDRLGQPQRKLNLGVAFEFPAPELAVQHALLEIGVREEVFAVETARPLADAGVELFDVVGAAHHQDAVVVLQPVDFVEEVAAHGGADEAVEILEHQEARGHRTRFGEDGLDRALRAVVAGQGAHVEVWDGVRPVGEGVHHGFDGDGFAVAGRPVVDDPALPRHFELFIFVLRVEERVDNADEGLFHLRVEDHVVPARMLDLAVEVFTFVPVSSVENKDFIVYLILVFRDL